MTTDCRAFGYEADDRWAKLPAGFGWKEVAAVATDSRDRVFVFNRGEHPLMVFDRDGTFLDVVGRGRCSSGRTASPSARTTASTAPTTRATPSASSRRDGELLLTLGTQRQALRHRARRASTSARSRTPGRRSTTRPTSRLRPTASCTSPTATATPASTSSRPTAGCSVLVGRAGQRAGAVPRAARHRDRPRRHRVRRRPREQPHPALHARRRVPLRVDRPRPAVPGVHRPRRATSTSRSWATAPGCGRARPPPTPDATGGRVSVFDRERQAARALGRRRQPDRAGRLLRPARHLRRFARRRLRRRGDVVRGRQSRAGAAGLPLAAEVRPCPDLPPHIHRTSPPSSQTYAKAHHESLAVPRLRRHAARRRPRTRVRAGARHRRAALRAAERHRGAARAGHPDAGLRPRQAAAGDRSPAPALRPRVLRPRPRSRPGRDARASPAIASRRGRSCRAASARCAAPSGATCAARGRSSASTCPAASRSGPASPRSPW